jgi:hypothetical protein
MRTYGGIAVMMLILMGFPLLAHAQQSADKQMTAEQFATMKSVTLRNMETRQAKLDDVKACINASTQRSELEKCVPALNYGVTEVPGDQRAMLVWKQKSLDGIAKRQAKLDEAKVCVKAATTPAELKKCRMDITQNTAGQKNFGAQ